MCTNSTNQRLSRTSALTTLAAAVTVGLTALGLAPPAVALNERVDGDTASTGLAGFTVSVTATVFGDPLAPVAVTVTVPV